MTGPWMSRTAPIQTCLFQDFCEHVSGQATTTHEGEHQ